MPKTPRAQTIRRTPPHWLVTVSAFLLPVAALPAAWWLIGDQSSDMPPGAKLDYYLGPWRFPAALETTAGVLGLLIAVVAVAVLLHAGRSGTWDPRWQTVVSTLTVVTVLLAVGLRILTAGGIGANIGAGMALLGLFPIAGLLLALAAYRIWTILRPGRTRPAK